VPEPPRRADIGAYVHRSMKCTIDPCQDFYRYACGGYLAEQQSGGDERWFAGSHEQIERRNHMLAQAILEVASATKKKSHERRVLGDFFDACMAQEHVPSAVGLEALRPRLAEIDAISAKSQVVAQAGALARIQAAALFGIRVVGHPRAPETGVVALVQPSHPIAIEHLRGESARSNEYFAGQTKLVERLLAIHGASSSVARERAAAVMQLERTLAAKSRTAVEFERGVPSELATFEALAQRWPQFPWLEYADGLGFPHSAQIVVDPQYAEHVATTFAGTDVETLEAYLIWRTLWAFASDGGSHAREAARWFEEKILLGIPPSRAVSHAAFCVDRANAWLPELIAQHYVHLELPPESRALATDVSRRVQVAFGERIAARDWLDEPTRAAATAKLEGITLRVGHPDAWRDYGGFQLEPEDHLANVIHIAKAELELALYTVGRTRDAEEWPSSPVRANAQYEASRNTVTMNAGLLQWPVFRADQPMVMNFAGAGMITGHELAHAFDLGSIDHDAAGRQSAWLVGSARVGYEERLQCLVRDLDARVGTSGVATSGELVRDEAMADLAGLRAAYRAWTRWNAEYPPSAPAIPGLTDEQLFFVMFAQTHCSDDTAAFEHTQAITDTHADEGVRVNATLAHVPEFADAFACGVGTPLHAAPRCEVW
jgi:putative endopeptidase